MAVNLRLVTSVRHVDVEASCLSCSSTVVMTRCLPPLSLFYDPNLVGYVGQAASLTVCLHDVLQAAMTLSTEQAEAYLAQSVAMLGRVSAMCAQHVHR